MPQSLIFTSVPIPFRTAFAHAAASRNAAENVIVCVMDQQGRIGLGEGCPRQYVTGETVKSAQAFLARHRESLCAIGGLDELRAWVAASEKEIDANPSAFCAAELALLDLFARQAGEPVEKLLAIEGAKPLLVSAVYSSGGLMKFEMQVLLFHANGLTDAKLKVTGATGRDARRVRRLSGRGKVRLDANNLWHGAHEAVLALRRIGERAWAVEEPVGARDWAGMAEVKEKTGRAIIADESLTRLSDLEAMPGGVGHIPNMRVSKLGGLLRSLNVLERAKAQKRKIIVGAQVGETSILARAGAVLAQAAGDDLIGYEGAYGSRLLSEDAVNPSLGFGRDGVVDLKPFAGKPGWGVVPAPVLAEALGKARAEGGSYQNAMRSVIDP
jgi:L-alanine-DL-glutamate epimerase-like enolase superfamily enzyme